MWVDSGNLFDPTQRVALIDDHGTPLGPRSSFAFSLARIPGTLHGVQTADGGWVVAWSEEVGPPFRWFRGHHFSADLTEVAPLDLVLYPSAIDPRLCADPSGFLLTGHLQLPSTVVGAAIQRFDNQGQPIGSPIDLGTDARPFCHTPGSVLTLEEIDGQLTVRRFDNTGAQTAAGSTAVPVGTPFAPRVAVHDGGRFAVFSENGALAFFDEALQPSGLTSLVNDSSFLGLEALGSDQYGALYRSETLPGGEGFVFSQLRMDLFDDQGNPQYDPLASRRTLQGSWASSAHFITERTIIQTSTGGWLMGLTGNPSSNENKGAATQRFEIDGPGTLEWAYSRHVVREKTGQLRIPVRRRGGTTGELAAQVTLPSNTPTTGISPLGLVVAPVFPDGDSQERMVVLQLTGNGVADGSRTHLLTLGAGDASETLELVILDDDQPSPLQDRGSFAVSAPGTFDNQGPVIAVGPDGAMLAAWEAPNTFGVAARRLAADGSPLEEPVDIDSLSFFDISTLPTVDALDSGGFTLAAALRLGSVPNPLPSSRFHWLRLGPEEPWPTLDTLTEVSNQLDAPLAMAEGRNQRILTAGEIDASDELGMRAFDALGRPIAEDSTAIAPYPGADSALASQPDGSGLLLWRNSSDGSGSGIRAVSLDPEGQPTGDIFLASQLTDGLQGHPDVEPLPGGGFLAVWHTLPHPSGTWRIVGRVFGRNGLPVGPEVPISSADDHDHRNPRLAVSGSDAVVVWDAVSVDGARPRAEAQALDLAGRPVGQPLPLGDPAYGIDQVDVDTNLAGDFTVVWRELDDGTGDPPSTVLGQRLAARAGCADDPHTLCLGGRFEVRLGWESPNLELGGVARAVPLTDDTGAFWFFDPDNLEVMLKVIDGRGTNGHFWIYFGALSDVRYTVSVADTLTGRTKVYRNPAGIQASVGDIQAFEELPTPPVVTVPVITVPVATPTGSFPKRARVNSAGKSIVLDRFQVDVAWRSTADCNDPSCQGEGTAVQLTDDTLAFWFFGDQNLEMAVKMVDGREVNGNFWVYFGALTNLGFDITITDLETGAVRTYSNTLGEFGSRGDIEAFPSGG